MTFDDYLRVSVDPKGKQKSQSQQLAENKALRDETDGWESSGRKPYTDTGSASPYATKKREGFDLLLADLRAGRFAADGIHIWESSRGSRKVSEWLTFLEVLAERGKLILVTTHGRLYDPSNDRDWKSLVDEATDAEYESRKSSKRIRRDAAASAANGSVPGGRRPYGYERGGKVIDTAEEAVIREAVARVLKGESVRSIAGDLNARGIPSATGGLWYPRALSAVVSGPRIAGLRAHKGVVVAKGNWPAILTEAEHARVVATIAGTSPVGRRGRQMWLLTGLLTCGRCGAALVGNTSPVAAGQTEGVRRYVCRKAPGYHGCGGLGIKAEPVEELLTIAAQERLVDVAARRDAAAGPGDEIELAELATIATTRRETAEDRTDGLISRETYREQMASLDRRQREVQARLAAKVKGTSPLDFVAEVHGAGRPLSALPTSERRAVLDALLESVTVDGAIKLGTTRFEPERITRPGNIVWKI